MALQKQDRIKQLAKSLKGSLDRGVDAIADKIRTAQVFAEEQSDVFSENRWSVRYSDYESVVYAVSTPDGTLFSINFSSHASNF